MELTLADTELLVKILGGLLTIGAAVVGWVLVLIRRHYARVEEQFDALEQDLRRDIDYLERRTADLEADLRACRNDLRQERGGFRI